MEHRDRVVLVTGASNGIGNACATFLAKKGSRVYGCCRNPAAYQKNADEFFELLEMDVTDEASVEKAVQTVLTREQRIDALICCAGTGLAGSLEDCSMQEIASQMDTNYLGTVRTIKALLPSMRIAGSGRIIVIGSIAGLTGIPFQASFSSSKYALEGLIESFRYEARPFGIEACIVEPGDFRTGLTTARRIAAKASDSPYKSTFESTIGIRVKDELGGKDPFLVAKLVFRLLKLRRLPARRTVGPGFQRIAAFSKRILPGPILEYFFRLYYKLP
jgi:NAD(P)-dependent dehydrogenase (short-subunit alcohol dehydrogenase family)